jgi:histone H3/H4
MSLTIVTPADEPLQMPDPALVPDATMMNATKTRKRRSYNEYSYVTAGVKRLIHNVDKGAIASPAVITTMASMYAAMAKRLEERAGVARDAYNRETMNVSDIKEAARYVLPPDVYDYGMLIYEDALSKRKQLEAELKLKAESKSTTEEVDADAIEDDDDGKSEPAEKEEEDDVEKEDEE